MRYFRSFFAVFLFLCSLEAAPKKPNILFIFADDMNLENIGAFGLSPCKTPHLDRLLEQGTCFTHAYNMGAWGGAVCTASRTMLNSGVFVNGARAAIKEHPQWAEWMKKAGYTTYMTGKWHVPGVRPKFDVTADVRGGMPRQTPEGYNRPKSLEDYKNGWKPWDRSKGGYWEGGTHWSEVVANHAISFLEQAKNDENPFFMYIAFNATHDPRQSPKAYIDMYPLESIKAPEDFLPEYPWAKQIGCDPHRLRDERLMPTPRTKFAVRVHLQEYYAIASHMDAQIGRILDALEKSGMAENTYIVFTADHGLSIGHHGLVGKQNMYECSLRVPFLLSGPGIASGKKLDMPIYLQDATPTILEWAGIQKPDYMQFKSLIPLLEEKEKIQYAAIYGKYKDDQRMILEDGWKLIAYPKAQKLLLFNTRKDPLEMHDLSTNPEYAPKLKKMKKALQSLQKQMDDPLDIDDPSAK